MSRQVNIGVIGVGHLGVHHASHLTKIKNANLIGIFDSDHQRSEEISKKLNTKSFESIDKLLDNVEALSIVTPTSTHRDVAERCIKKGKHVFIEKPVTSTVDDANHLIELAKKHRVIIQVGHIERFNPALLALSNLQIDPKYIEVHRMAPFMSRGTDVPVVLDLMIHDIDIILSIIDSKVMKLSANGTKIISNTPDIANARIEFENGCVANLTASRLSLKKMRKMRIFQSDSYISIDFDKSKSEIVNITNYDKKNKYAMTIHNSDGIEKEIKIKKYDNLQVNSIVQEHNDFALSINNQSPPKVTFETGRDALELAFKILEKIDSQ